MKKLLYLAVAAIAALSSCKDDIINENVNDNHNEKANATVFTATIEGEGETRTTLADGTNKKVNWVNGDKININGKIYSTTSTTDEAEFIADGEKASTVSVDGTNVYIASYPSTVSLSVTTVGSTPTIAGIFPDTQKYDATTNGIGNIPMAAVSTTTTLAFKNICAVLAITVPSTEMSTVKSIMVTSDKQMNGNCCVAFTNATTFEGPYLAFLPSQSLTDAQRQLKLDCGTSGVSIASGSSHTFYIAIPAQEYKYLTIFLSADGTTYKEAMATKVADGLGAIARNKIYPITYAMNAVQLWADGPYFATVNVGQTNPYSSTSTDYTTANIGGYYCWGGSTAWTSTPTTDAYSGSDFDANNNLKPENDTATKLWGSAWRMPTQTELEALGAGVTGLSSNNQNVAGTNTTWSWCDGSTNQYVAGCTLAGYKIEGNGNSIFLPAAGLYNGSDRELFGLYGEYWSSTCLPKTYDWEQNHTEKLEFRAGNMEVGSKEIHDGEYYTVRPVLATPAAAPAPTPVPTSNLLSGEFSVGADKKVQFTKGNLWCNTTTNPVTYAFETNQYDYPVATDYTSDGTKDGTWLGTHVGHFFWTTAAAASYAQKYDVNAFLTFNGGVNKTSDKFWLDGSDASHKLTVSGTSDLYVLSNDEWTYLLETRANHSSLCKCGVTVAGKTGCLIIAPDDYTGSIDTEYTAAEWATAEAAGLVCLPFAGRRDNDNPFKAGTSGDYWTSTAGSDANQAFKICFISEGAYPDTKSSRVNGFPLRLVKTAQ